MRLRTVSVSLLLLSMPCLLLACAEKKDASEKRAPTQETPPPGPLETPETPEPAEEPVEEPEAPAAEEPVAGGEDQSDLDCHAEGVDCPLYEFQETYAQTAVEENDVEAVAKVLHQIEFFAPDPSWNEGENGWAQIARRGAVAAEAGNMREARKACRECHRQYPNEEMPFRKMYETQGFRTRALPELPENAATTGLPDLV